MHWVASLAAIIACSPNTLAERPDIVLADFEQRDYSAWLAAGEAFGPGPAQGALPGQMAVTGYRGHGLVNSFYKGDPSTGTLTSPSFRIDRKYLNFLIGGGSHPGKTGIRLLINGMEVRTSTGHNAERLDWSTWDVSAYEGQQARIEIFDQQTGGWGHINVDEITQSDRKLAEEIKTSPLYAETYRPQFHFTAQNGWLNDPNGLVWDRGEYHLFFQHNPKGTEWGNMTWGHAVSKDLLHWEQLPNAIEPDSLGTIFSGSAVMDTANTAGFRARSDTPLVAIYTAAGGTNDASKGQKFTQCIAYSLDRGRTFTKFAGNPVLKHIAGENRDPKVVWHAPTKRWIMALYLDGNEYALFASSNLKEWTELQRLKMRDCSECPDFFPMKVDDNTNREKWVFTAANGKYLVGDFDGQRFTSEADVEQVEFGANCYAVQTYSGIPERDGRRIQMAWMNGGSYPQMPFNQQMAFPCELILRPTKEGLRLFKRPIEELEKLRRGGTRKTYEEIEENAPVAIPLSTDLFEVQLEAEVEDAQKIELRIFGESVTFNEVDSELSALGRKAPLEPIDGKIKLQVLVDRTSLEVFGNGGAVALTSCFLPRHSEKPLEVRAIGGHTGKVTLTVYPLKSAWPAIR